MVKQQIRASTIHQENTNWKRTRQDCWVDGLSTKKSVFLCLFMSSYAVYLSVNFGEDVFYFVNSNNNLDIQLIVHFSISWNNNWVKIF